MLDNVLDLLEMKNTNLEICKHKSSALIAQAPG